MKPKRVASFSFFFFFYSSFVVGNYTLFKEYNLFSIPHTTMSFKTCARNIPLKTTNQLSTQSHSLSSEQTATKTNNQISSTFGMSIDKLAQRYVLVIKGPTPVYKELNPQSPILGMANRGKTYPLVKIGDSWCVIQFGQRTGWIERKNVSIVDSASSSFVWKEFFVYFVLAATFSGSLWLLFILINKNKKLNSEWFSSPKTSKKILIVTEIETPIQKNLTNTPTTIVKFFREMGFEVETANSAKATKKLVNYYLPDALVVDWRLGANTQSVIEQIIGANPGTRHIFVLFYNVPDLLSISPSQTIPHVQYLGLSFTDKELFKSITPLIMTGTAIQSVTKSIESSALQGNIADGGVSEVFQFVEIGRKTGCLLLEDEKPIGIVYFNDGIIIYAATKINNGKKAVFEILNLQNGQFQFVLDKKPKSPNCSIPTLGILMEWTRVTDENSRNRLRTT